MNNDYLARAKERIPDPQILSVVAAKRAKQLALVKARPMVKCDSKQILDVALLEIAEGLLSYEFITPGQEGAVSEADVEVSEKEDQE